MWCLKRSKANITKYLVIWSCISQITSINVFVYSLPNLKSKRFNLVQNLSIWHIYKPNLIRNISTSKSSRWTQYDVRSSLSIDQWSFPVAQKTMGDWGRGSCTMPYNKQCHTTPHYTTPYHIMPYHTILLNVITISHYTEAIVKQIPLSLVCLG